MPRKDEFYKLVDEGYLATWDFKTGVAIQNMTKAFRENILSEIEADIFFSGLEKAVLRKWNDHQSGYEGFGEPLEVSYKYDGVTDYGLSLFCALIVGKDWPRISHMGAGDGVGDTVDYQDILVSERIRYKFNENGYMNSLGKTLRFHMTFDINVPSFTFKEIGIFNNEFPNVGPMIARTTFDPGTLHTAGQNYVTASYLVSTLSS